MNPKKRTLWRCWAKGFGLDAARPALGQLVLLALLSVGIHVDERWAGLPDRLPASGAAVSAAIDRRAT